MGAQAEFKSGLERLMRVIAKESREISVSRKRPRLISLPAN